MRDLALPDELWSYLKPAGSGIDLIEALAQTAHIGSWSELERHAAWRLTVILKDLDIMPLVNALQSRIIDYPQVAPNDVPEVLKTLIDLVPRCSQARGVLENLGQSEALIQLTALFNQAGNFEAVALCTLPLLSNNFQIGQITNPGWAQNSPQWRSWNGRQLFIGWFQTPASYPALDVIAAHCLSWLTFPEWREASTRGTDRAQLILRMIAARFKQASVQEVDTSELVTHIDFWRGTVADSDLERILQVKASSGELTTCLSSRPFDPNLIHLYALAMQKDGNKAYRQFLTTSLLDVTKEQWLQALNAETELLDLALSLKVEGLKLGLAFHDSLFAHVEGKLAQSDGAGPRKDWSNLIDLLSESDLNAFRLRLLGAFKSINGKVGSILPLYGPLLAQLVLEDGPEKSYERIKQIIENHDVAEVEWLTALVRQWRPQSKSIKDACKTWSKRVEEVLENDLSEYLRNSLQNLLGALDGKLAIKDVFDKPT
jgi:hypothetical protein